MHQLCYFLPHSVLQICYDNGPRVAHHKSIDGRKKGGGTKVRATAILPVTTGGVFGSGVEAQGVVIFFLSCMTLGGKYLAIFIDVGCLAVLHRKISKEASQGLTSLSPLPY